MQKVIFIGLGTMGYHMAGHLSKNTNVKLSVFNRTTKKARKWQDEFSGNIVTNLKEQIHLFDVIILCAGRDEDMNEIFFDDDNGIANNIKSYATVIDHTTISYDMTLNLANSLQKNAVNFIDAPVSGGEIGAINGTLSVMAGGDKNSIEKVEHIISSYSKNLTHMGKIGSGQLAKMANQICISGILQGLSEALIFAEQNNLDIEKLLSAISGGAAGSWQMENRLLTMHKREFYFGFAIKWMIKDLSYALKQAKSSNLDLELTEEVYNKYQDLSSRGCENFDTSALFLYKEK